jgi:hypothetical protein
MQNMTRPMNIHKRFFTLIALFIFALSAQATETDCLKDVPCATENAVAAPNLRASIDKARSAISDKLFGFQISVFGDIHTLYTDSGANKADRGAYELDASGDLREDLQVALALVDTPTNTTMTVGFIDYSTSGKRLAPRGRLPVGNGYHIQAGRFDAPFGNDWQFFASKDSTSISRPATTELIMNGGYNDTGLRIMTNNGSVNTNAYVMKGFNQGNLYGGRIGLTPFSDPFSLNSANQIKPFELGFSYFFDAATSVSPQKITSWAFDAEVTEGNWHGRTEYIERKQEPLLGQNTRLNGWHLTQEYGLGEMIETPSTIFLRYDLTWITPSEIVLGNENGDERDGRITTGFKTQIGSSDVFQWKFEIQHYILATPTTRSMPGFGKGTMWFSQLVFVL